MKPVSILAGAIGIALIGVLVVHFGAGAVARSLLAVGWAGFAAICLIHLALIAVMGLAWWALLPGTNPWSARQSCSKGSRRRVMPICCG